MIYWKQQEMDRRNQPGHVFIGGEDNEISAEKRDGGLR